MKEKLKDMLAIGVVVIIISLIALRIVYVQDIYSTPPSITIHPVASPFDGVWHLDDGRQVDIVGGVYIGDGFQISVEAYYVTAVRVLVCDHLLGERGLEPPCVSDTWFIEDDTFYSTLGYYRGAR